ncbi:MAG: hypothetical protein E5Y06_32375 [Mesorhizobium sp.]|nr:MAG: hypothetical protein E5Y06_32375 [Mesorhizobium sp.]TJU93871.1 MAG: hypothetical protein E5Y08_32375 [Mesorhizobium sp.]TJV13343.1 MAG: hypothetical protein E5Y07_32000 [Mesorhizobium sp.]
MAWAARSRAGRPCGHRRSSSCAVPCSWSPQSTMPKSVKRFSDDIKLYLFDLEPDSDFRST